MRATCRCAWLAGALICPLPWSWAPAAAQQPSEQDEEADDAAAPSDASLDEGSLELRLDDEYGSPDAAFRQAMLVASWLAPSGGRPSEAENTEEAEEGAEREPPFALEIHGYGELDFAYHDFGPNQTGIGGAPPDSRLVFDQTRFAMVLEAELGAGFEFEAEIEFEHGGTGAVLELEYEEYGEYEFDVERGGEIVVEELVLRKDFDGWLRLGIGRIYVAMGVLPSRHRPHQFLGTTRPESETRVIPAVWDELGVEARLHLDWFHFTLQVVSGMDSTGFSSQYWITSGHQERFELVRGTDPGFVGRVDLTPIEGLTFGVSGYVGNTTGNRPTPDLQGVAGEIAILSGHAVLEIAPVRAQGLVLFGTLADSADISDRNRRLSNNLEVLRSPVASQAMATWAELGFDVFHFFPELREHRLEPFVRVEWYDTMFAVAEGVFDNPRFERLVLSGGLAYTHRAGVVLKLDFTNRTFGSPDIRPESTGRLAVGFIY